MENGVLIPLLFRTEYRKIVTVLCKRFGFDQIEIAEDIASDTFMTAMQSWGLGSIPPNPTAWLYNVAKNKAKNYLHHCSLFENKIAAGLKSDFLSPAPDEIDLSPQNINDSQLQMMFAVCHPSISAEAKVGLSLRILCGFGIDEIASAFLTNKETINKRLHRAKQKLREQAVKIEMPSVDEIDQRLEPVLTTIYLLFNEGYYSAGKNQKLRKSLCFEAMRLCTMLVENKRTNRPEVNALLALMCFHASRFDARTTTSGELILYDEQDTSLWNPDLISKGAYFLSCSASGNTISKYHLEAEIAYWNTQKAGTNEKWENMLQLYDDLLAIAYSPITALNRIYALYKARGNQEAIAAAKELSFAGNHFYLALLGELYTGIDNKRSAKYYEDAFLKAKTQPEKQAIKKKLDRL